MANIIERKEQIERETRWLFHMEEADHFWLRVDTLDLYLDEICGYSNDTITRLRSSGLFCNWWTVQCLIVEDRILRHRPESLYLTEAVYKTSMRLHLTAPHIQANHDMIAQRAIKESTTNLNPITNGR